MYIHSNTYKSRWNDEIYCFDHTEGENSTWKQLKDANPGIFSSQNAASITRMQTFRTGIPVEEYDSDDSLEEEYHNFVVLSDNSEKFYSVEKTDHSVAIQFSNSASKVIEYYGQEARLNYEQTQEYDVKNGLSFTKLIEILDSERHAEYDAQIENSNAFAKKIVESGLKQTKAKKIKKMVSPVMWINLDEQTPTWIDGRDVSYEQYFQPNATLNRIEVYSKQGGLMTSFVGGNTYLLLTDTVPSYHLLQLKDDEIQWYKSSSLRTVRQHLDKKASYTRKGDSNFKENMTFRRVFNYVDAVIGKSNRGKNIDSRKFAKGFFKYFGNTAYTKT